MNKNKELVKNTIIIFIGKFCTQFITLLLLPLYTHFLSTEDYGYIDLIQTYLTFFIPLILLKIDAGIFRFLIDARKSEEEKNKIITNGIFIMFVELIISTILFAVAVKIFSIKYSILIVMNLISLSVLTFLLQIVRGIGKNKQYSFSSIIAAIVTIVLNLIFLVGFHKNGKYVLIASLISNIICTIYLLIVNKILKNVKIKYIDKKLIKDLLKYSIPMIPNELSWFNWKEEIKRDNIVVKGIDQGKDLIKYICNTEGIKDFTEYRKFCKEDYFKELIYNAINKKFIRIIEIQEENEEELNYVDIISWVKGESEKEKVIIRLNDERDPIEILNENSEVIYEW